MTDSMTDSSIYIDRIISQDAPNDGNIYGRYNNRWIKIDLYPEPIGWYLKTASNKVDEDNNEIIDYVLEPEIIQLDEEEGGHYGLNHDSDQNIIFKKVQKTDSKGNLLFEADEITPIYKQDKVPYIMEASNKIKKPLKKEKFIAVYVYQDGTELDASQVEWSLTTIDESDFTIAVNEEDQKIAIDANGNITATIDSNGNVESKRGSRIRLVAKDLKYGLNDLEIKWDIVKSVTALKIRGIPTELNDDGTTKVPQKLKQTNNPDFLRAVYLYDDNTEEDIPFDDVYWFVDDEKNINFKRPASSNDANILFTAYKEEFVKVTAKHKKYVDTDKEDIYTDILAWRVGKVIKRIKIMQMPDIDIFKIGGNQTFTATVFTGEEEENDETNWVQTDAVAWNGSGKINRVEWFIAKKRMNGPDQVKDTNTDCLLWDADDTNPAVAIVTSAGKVTTLHSTNEVFLVVRVVEDGNEFTDFVRWSIRRSVKKVDIVENSGINTEIGLNADDNDPVSLAKRKFHAIFTYDEGDPEIATQNLMWMVKDVQMGGTTISGRQYLNIIPAYEPFTWGTASASNALIGIMHPRKTTPDGTTVEIMAAYTGEKDSDGNYTIFDTRPIVIRSKVVRLKINETPNDHLKVPYGKQEFSVTKVYDTGEEAPVSEKESSNLEWTITPPGAAFADATTGEVTSLIANDMGVTPVPGSTDTDVSNLTQTDVILRVDWRGKNGEVAPQYIDTVSIDEDGNEITNKILNPDYVECDQVHWRIMNKPVKIQIFGFDKNISINEFTDKTSYSVIDRVGQNQEFRAIITYADGTTDVSLAKKEIYKKHIKNPKKLGEDRNGTPIIGTEINNENKFGFLDTFGVSKNIMWTIEYPYNEEFSKEISNTTWKYGSQLNNIIDLYTYPYVDKLEEVITYKENPKKLGEDRNGTPIIGTEITDMSDAPNKTSYALIAHVTALKPGKARLYCTYINDPSICDWVDFEIKRSITEMEIIG